MKKLTIFIFFLLLYSGIAGAQENKIHIGFVTPGTPEQTETRYSEILALLRREPGREIIPVDFKQIGKEMASHKFDLMILYSTDSLDFENPENHRKSLTALKGYFESGGKVILAMESMKLLPSLGLEDTAPEVRRKSCIDEGYGRKLGYHAFRDHPVFKGMNGGAYVQVPEKDLTVRIIGYFGTIIPQGKVVAVDWDYIFLREESKMILEYETGKGKVVAVGSYMFYDIPNRNRLHLERFTENLVTYSLGETRVSWKNYWHYGPGGITECPEWPQNDRMFLEIPRSSVWQEYSTEMKHVKQGSDNFFDLAGERILIMGKEKAGIDEIWTHPFMSIYDYIAGVQLPGSDSTTWLDKIVPEVTITPWSFTRTYITPSFTLKEMLAADPREPNGVVHYEYEGEAGSALKIRMTSNLRFMWPYSERVTADLCYRWLPDYPAFGVTDYTGDLMTVVGANRTPELYEASGNDEQTGIILTYRYRLDQQDQIDFVITGTSEGFDQAIYSYDRAIRNPQGIMDSSRDHISRLFSTKLELITPDPVFNEGYKWALAGTDRFFVTTPEMGSSLVAGYSTTKRGWDGGHKINGRPGYGWYFGRDGQWSGFALIDYGDFEKVRQILNFYEKYQDLNGKIFHEATTSGVIHYDAADATPLYIALAGKYFRHSGDTGYLRASWRYIKNAIEYCLSTDTDRDKLIENTNVGHGWVEGGELFGSHATYYLNGCWALALDEAASMADFMNDTDETYYKELSLAVKAILNKDFWIPSPSFGGPLREMGHFSYGLNKDGSYRNEVTILPAVPLGFGFAEPMKASSQLGLYAGNNFSTNWGVRIIGEESPLFRPTGYHYGSVWPLFTGWTSLAEYRYGKYPQAFMHMMTNLRVYKSWAYGFVEEVLNGSVYEPSGVCPHQCWSETMVVQPAIEGMLGLHVDTPSNRIKLKPALPFDWDSVNVRNIRFNGQSLSFRFTRKENKSQYIFINNGPPVKVDFYPVFPAGTYISEVTTRDGSMRTPVFTHPDYLDTYLSLNVTDTLTLSIVHTTGTGVVPLMNEPIPGEQAAGPRILESRLTGDHYVIETEGPQGASGLFRIYADPDQVQEITGADETGWQGNILTLKVTFPASESKYSTKSIQIRLIKK